MTDFENRNEERKNRWEEKRNRWKEKKSRWEMRMERRMERGSGNGHIWTGVLLLIVGGLALAKSVGADIPDWLFSWQMLLIAIGLFIGLKKGFNNSGWFIPVLIGGLFLANNYYWHGQMYRHIWPIILIIVGAMFLFKPKSKRWRECSEKKRTDMKTEDTTPFVEVTAGTTNAKTEPPGISEDDYLDTTSIFGGTEKVILSKNFKGGNMLNIFGGSEINLTQADINGTARLDVTAIFGGATLIVPSNWVVKSEAVTIFGGISDKRSVGGYSDSAAKNLIIKGTILFGGLEIKSF
jgi:predicted membrane protein